MKTEWKIHTENMPGNMHEAATTINKWGWAEYLIQMDGSGHYTICAFRMPADMVRKIRAASGSYISEPSHDDVCCDPITLRRL